MNDYIDLYQNIIISHFSLFPIGLIILSSNDIKASSASAYIVSYINPFASTILPLTLGMTIDNNKDVLCSYRKRELNQLSNVTLWDTLFNSNFTDINETFFSDCFMVYIKIKFSEENIYISIDNLNEQRKTLQDKMIKSISYQFLTSIAHEINNPLDSLINTIEQITQTNSTLLNRLRLLVCLIKSVTQKLIAYSKSIFDSIQLREKHQSPPLQSEIVNLNYIFNKLSKKFALLFDYKRIIIDNDFSLLQKCSFKCDRYYLKQLIKNLLLYLYYQVPKDSKISIVSTIQNSDLVKMTFQHEGVFKERKFRLEKSSDKKLVSESEIILDASVNTIDTCKEILVKLSAFVDVDVFFIEEDNIYLTLDFNHIIFDSSSSDTDEQDEVDEFNTPRKNSSVVPTYPPLNTFDLLKNSKKNVPVAFSSKNLVSNCNKEFSQLVSAKKNRSNCNSEYNSNSKDELNKKLKVTFNDQYSQICSNLGRSLAKILADMRDPIIDNMKSPLIMSKSINKNDTSFHEISRKTILKEEDVSSSSFQYLESCGKKKKSIGMNTTGRALRNHTPTPTPRSIKSHPLPEVKQSRILIVDDEDFNVKTLQNMLKLEKQVADICYNGFESIQYLKKNPNVKLVLMDICMPVMDGLEACKHIEEMVKAKEINPNIVVIIISAHPPDIIHSGNLHYQVVKNFFKKPLSRCKLKGILKDYNLI